MYNVIHVLHIGASTSHIDCFLLLCLRYCLPDTGDLNLCVEKPQQKFSDKYNSKLSVMQHWRISSSIQLWIQQNESGLDTGRCWHISQRKYRARMVNDNIFLGPKSLERLGCPSKFWIRGNKKTHNPGSLQQILWKYFRIKGFLKLIRANIERSDVFRRVTGNELCNS